MTTTNALQRDQLVDEIVRRVVLRLNEGSAVENGQASGEPFDFSGRLLTMERLSQLSLGEVLRVRERCIVTPEVADELKQRRVTLQRLPMGPEPKRAAAGLTVWEKLECGPQVRWLASWGDEQGAEYRSDGCPTALLRQLGGPRTPGKHVVVTDSDWAWQQALSQAGVFAPRLRLDDAQDWDALQRTDPVVVILRSPVTRWQLTKLWRTWVEAGGER